MRRFHRFLGPAAFCLLAGCGSPGGEPAAVVASVVPASGKVVLADGRPAANLWVVFHPRTGPGNEAVAATDPDGTFQLGTFGKGDGAIPGRYVVTVEPHPRPRGATPRVAKKYARAEASPLEVEVTPGGANEIPPLVLR